MRDQLGLTYDVSFELFQFDRHPGGWFSVHVTSSPQKIHDAVNASAQVLRNIAKQAVTARELARWATDSYCAFVSSILIFLQLGSFLFSFVSKF